MFARLAIIAAAVALASAAKGPAAAKRNGDYDPAPTTYEEPSYEPAYTTAYEPAYTPAYEPEYKVLYVHYSS